MIYVPAKLVLKFFQLSQILFVHLRIEAFELVIDLISDLFAQQFDPVQVEMQIDQRDFGDIFQTFDGDEGQ